MPDQQYVTKPPFLAQAPPMCKQRGGCLRLSENVGLSMFTLPRSPPRDTILLLGKSHRYLPGRGYPFHEGFARENRGREYFNIGWRPAEGMDT